MSDCVKVWCLRHAESENVIAGVAGAVPAAALTPRGRREAIAAARVLDGEPIRRIYCSTAVRAQQTAAALAASRGLDIVALAALAEVGIGRHEGTTDPAVRRQTADVLRAWIIERDLDQRVADGESGRQVLTRMSAAFHQIAAANLRRNRRHSRPRRQPHADYRVAVHPRRPCVGNTVAARRTISGGMGRKHLALPAVAELGVTLRTIGATHSGGEVAVAPWAVSVLIACSVRGVVSCPTRGETGDAVNWTGAAGEWDRSRNRELVDGRGRCCRRDAGVGADRVAAWGAECSRGCGRVAVGAGAVRR
ncbi:histidine phosphatase family protein [Nocardia sp. NPDC050175]|uniref:histidine phosphatase family protein n=1 Tax=Nocardia sp. NPDC050175 TaxID=3364317 RepID=UPI003797B7F5